MQVLPVPQQLSGCPIEEQSFVPVGHLNPRFISTSLALHLPYQSSFKLSSIGRKAASNWAVIFASSLRSFPGCSLFSASSRSDANIQLSNRNISPSSLLIFFTPMGFSTIIFFWIFKLRLTCTSSSGKYFRCFGKLCGHCGSAEQRTRRRAGGSASSSSSFISSSL